MVLNKCESDGRKKMKYWMYNILIWLKKKKKFVPIFPIRVFAEKYEWTFWSTQCIM